MKKLGLVLLLLSGLSFGQAASGGAAAPPPLPNTLGTDVITNGIVNTATSWTLTTACATYDAATTSTADGSGSIKIANPNSCGTGAATAVTMMAQPVAGCCTQEAFLLTFDELSDATAGPVPLAINFNDNTHSSVIPLNVGTTSSVNGSAINAYFTDIGVSSGWVKQSHLLMVNQRNHAGDTWQLQFKPYGTSTATIWIDNIKLQPIYFPLRTFIKYPNYRWLWTDITPPARDCNGTTALAQICGASEIVPIPGQNLAGSTLTVKMATVAGCGSGVLNTQTFPAPAATQHWQITPAQYGAVVAGTVYYVCSQLTVTSGGAIQATYSDWTIVPEPSSFRTGLMNYFDENGIWYHNQIATLAFGAFDRWGSLRYGSTTRFKAAADCSGYVSSPASAKDCYIRGVKGFSSIFSPTATPSATAPAGSIFADYRLNRFGPIMQINPASGSDPTSGNDYVTPMMDAYADYGQTHLQILNSDFGKVLSETNAEQAPTGSALSSAAGSINTATHATVYARWTALGWPIPIGSVGTESFPAETQASTEVHIILSGQGCAPNCAVVATSPACGARIWGYRLNLSDDNVTYDRKYPTYAGKLADNWPIPCNTQVTYSTWLVSGLTFPANETNDSANRAPWIAATADKVAWKRYTDTMIAHAGAAGVYIGDEDVLGSFATSWYMGNYLAGVANALPSVGVLQYDSGMNLYRDVVDVPVHDPYGYALASSPDERIYGPTNNNCNAYTSANDNVTHAITTCFPNRVDIWGNDDALNTYGSRPTWTVVQNFFRASTGLYPYPELWKQYWKAYIACENLGNRGCGVLVWGSVSSIGMEDAFYTRGNTNAWQEEVNANNHFVDLVSKTFTRPVGDSTYLGYTTYLTAVTVNGSSWAAYGSKSSVCPSGASVNGYQDSTAWPSGPIRIVTTKDSATGDIYYHWTNLCSASFTFSATLSTIPSGQTKVEVEDETGKRTPLTLSGSTLTDTWNGFGAGVYILRALNGQSFSGKITMN